ncbi:MULTISPECIES: GNAT family N-acetyltransferase [unclassified Marinomonas]|uniref:GNAT family N-acetyltransferase n=1 Tax=unclassified Marinomonas TaxID=196814 RepID=UPI001E62DE54|nr:MULTISPECIES: GNAT family N-acetyltransferase [unclassified Marinomonas]
MTENDFKMFWPTFETTILAEQTYAFDSQMGYEEALQLWLNFPLKTYIFEEDGVILGSYYIKANAMGPSSHISNCGYMVSETARGKGIARKMCEHSQMVAKEIGFTAMQFNSVVSTNKIAIKLWQALGFDIIGTIPKAYKHKELGLVDAYIMHKLLDD